MITLYQFPVSHYCEKVRWALLHKRLPHNCKSMLPGLHRKKMQKISGQSSVPVLQDGKTSVAGSLDIISYLDREYPRFPLTPETSVDANKALEWERWADAEIGPAVRVLMYSVLIQHPDVLRNMMGQEGPWYASFYLKKAMPKIIGALTKGYNIVPDNIDQSKAVLDAAIEKLQTQLNGDTFLVGSEFSRADLSVAALFAPVFRIAKYGLQWPDNMPEALFEIESDYKVIRPWVDDMYTRFMP